MKNMVPIVFCFDDNLELAAGVCISSLLQHAHPDTFYDIFILHSDICQFPFGRLNELPAHYGNCRITYRTVSREFEQAFEIRGITVATYYRLLIPELIPEYDKVLYSDVDVIFRDDLSDIYINTDMEGCYVAGVSTPYSDMTAYVETVIKTTITQYIAAGNLIFNNKKLREDGVVERFKQVALKKWKYQDMDTINIVCAGKIKQLPPWFCMTYITFEILNTPNQSYYPPEVAEYARKYGIIHYNGPKPWNQYCLNFDIWWQYYRKSIFFDEKFYYDFYVKKMNEYDSLSLWKRVKILLRYFKMGGIIKQ